LRTVGLRFGLFGIFRSLVSFGSFIVRQKRQRIGRNPKTGKEVPIAPRQVMVFKASAILRRKINSPEGPSHRDNADGPQLSGTDRALLG
jgi:hypothetical protein